MVQAFWNNPLYRRNREGAGEGNTQQGDSRCPWDQVSCTHTSCRLPGTLGACGVSFCFSGDEFDSGRSWSFQLRVSWPEVRTWPWDQLSLLQVYLRLSLSKKQAPRFLPQVQTVSCGDFFTFWFWPCFPEAVVSCVIFWNVILLKARLFSNL